MDRAQRPRVRGAHVAVGLGLLIPGWIVLWATTDFLNPLAFLLLWTGAAVLMWSAHQDYPGVRRHLTLASISVPLWWYFEAINSRTQNWEYLGRDRYDDIEFAILASLAFATVVPALVAAIIAELSQGARRRASVVGAAGLLCGGLWEFWNFWAFPKWIYDIPALDFFPIFEMPILGYGGYVPFAWSVLQLVVLVDIGAKKIPGRTPTP
jgi:hypothetical protein